MNLPRRFVLSVFIALAATPFVFVAWNAMAPGDDPALVFAPSSLAPLEDTIDAALEAERIPAVEWVFAGSQSLVAQIADGAPADVLITADRVTFDAAIAAGFDGAGGRITIATNHLVLAVAPGNPGSVESLDDLADPDLLIGLCAVEVPCGRLAAEALDSVGGDVEPSVDTRETSVRALTTKIASGELDAGLIYRSDAIAAGLDVIDEAALADVITIYQRAWTGDRAHSAFATFLNSFEFEQILLEAGFGT
ncbi:MAG: substrate-binding domain-containing protein [Actinomycetota bacterium]